MTYQAPAGASPAWHQPPAAQPKNQLGRYRVISFITGGVALAAGLVLEYVPLYHGTTIPKGNAVCSGVTGLFIQGMAKAFGGSKAGDQVSSACSLATTGEHFIGPLIAVGILGLLTGLGITIAQRNGIKITHTAGE